MTKICWRFSENFESPKNYKIYIFNTPKFLFLPWRLDIQNDWFEVVRKNQQIFKKCEKFLKKWPARASRFWFSLLFDGFKLRAFSGRPCACQRYYKVGAICAKILKGRRDAWRHMLKIELCRALPSNKVLRFFQIHDFL